MSNLYLKPSIGSSGVVKLKDPFTGLCADNIPYEVLGLQTLQAIAATNQDPYALYYEPYGISREKFVADVADKVCIVELQSSDGEMVRVPNSYLESLPIATGVPYATMFVTVNLGALPQDLSLAYFMAKVADMARDLMGVQDAQVRAMRASTLTYLSIEDASTIEAARKAVMETVITDAARLMIAEENLSALQTKYSDLEAFVLANNPPPP
jgi:hypothetical protein